jgi:hypothetical protein
MAARMLPRFCRVRQSFDSTHLADPAAAVMEQLAGLALEERVRPGDEIAITAGSRGIANLPVVTAAVVQFVRERLNANPFVVPAMGSHGGATAEGQLKVLASLGCTPEGLGCDIRSSMETAVVIDSGLGFPVHFDRHAYSAQHVILVNRVKAHTGIFGNVESGLLKMLLIGLGKHAGAALMHQAMADWTFDQIVAATAAQVLEKCRVLCGVALVENAAEQTALVRALPAQRIPVDEPELLRTAKQMMARLPFDRLDLLLIDEMGKNISGTGMDTNVIGRKSNDHVALHGETPAIKRICVRDLTPKTGGNALGIGIAEFCRSQLVEKIDRVSTAVNSITSLHPAAAMIPIHHSTDREMLAAAGQTLGLVPLNRCRMAWIRNTLQIEELECAEGLAGELAGHPQIDSVGPPRAIGFDAAGNLPWFTDIRG